MSGYPGCTAAAAAGFANSSQCGTAVNPGFTSNQASEERAALLEDKGIKVITIDSDGDKLPLDAVLKTLGKEIMSLLVEGAGRLMLLFWRQGCDKVYWFIAPKLWWDRHLLRWEVGSDPYGGSCQDNQLYH